MSTSYLLQKLGNTFEIIDELSDFKAEDYNGRTLREYKAFLKGEYEMAHKAHVEWRSFAALPRRLQKEIKGT